MQEKEKWKKLDENPMYYISSYGNMKSVKKVKGKNKTTKLKYTQDHGGYYKISIRTISNGYKKVRTFAIHKLVARYFLPKPTGNQNSIDHIDGDNHNNKVGNLRWLSMSDNYKNKVYKQYLFFVNKIDNIGGYKINAKFKTQEGAIEFCKRLGITYEY